MFLKLYDYNESLKQGKIKLHRLATFEERLSYIQEYIFDVEKYHVYYTQCPNRWLGIKIVNRPVKNENVKFTLDFITGYLLNAREYNVHYKKKRYLELLSLKSEQDGFTKELQGELSELQTEILYHKPSKSFKIGKNFVFVINRKYEDFLKNCLIFYEKEIKKTKNADYTLLYAKRKTAETLDLLAEIKAQARKTLTKVLELKSRRIDLKKIIEEEYLSIKIEKTATVLSILKYSIELKNINDSIRYLDEQMAQLHNEYTFLTGQ